MSSPGARTPVGVSQLPLVRLTILTAKPRKVGTYNRRSADRVRGQIFLFPRPVAMKILRRFASAAADNCSIRR